MALLAGPAIAFGGSATVVDCPTVAMTGGDAGCCGGEAGMPSCDFACAMSFPAAIGKEVGRPVAELARGPLQRRAEQGGRLGGPPEPAPPKRLFA